MKTKPYTGLVPFIIGAVMICALVFSGPALGAKNEIKGDNPSQPEMVYVPAGKFLMGSDSEEVERAWRECLSKYPRCGRHWFEAESPEHVVYLDAFFIDKTEVTQRAYRRCVQDGACSPPRRSFLFGNRDYDDFPIVFIDWFQAEAFCAWRGARLPTEAEWEKAARGIEGLRYPWGDEYEMGRAAFRFDKLQKVGAWPRGASPYGAFDMGGNVWEWVQDWYDPEYYSRSPRRNPKGPDTGERKIYRGGSWRSDLTIYLRTTHRNNFAPTLSDIFTGVRCAKDGEKAAPGGNDGLRGNAGAGGG